MQAVDDTRTYVDRDLIKQVKEKYPETAGMKNSPLVEWALRKLLVLGVA